MLHRASLVRRAFLLNADNLSQRVVRGAGYQFFGVALRMIVTIGSIAALARLLSPEDFGLIAMAAVVTEFAALFSNFGLTNVLVQHRRINRRQLDTVFWASMGIGATLTVAVVAAAFFSDLLFSDARIQGLLIGLSPSFLLAGLLAIPNVVLTRLLRFRTEFLIQLSTIVIRALVAIAFAWAGFGVWSLVAGALSGAIAQAMFSLIAVPFGPRLRFSWPYLQSTWRTSGSYFGSGLLHYVNTSFDVLLIGRSLGATSLGYYQTARSLTDEIRGRLAVPLQRVLFPAFSTLQGDREKLQQFVRRGATMLAAIVIPVSFGVSANAAELVRVLYGDRWLPMIFILQMFGLSAGFRAVSAVATALFSACNRVELSLRYNVIGTLAMVSAVTLSLPYGVNAVAASMAAASLYWLVIFRAGIGLIGLGTTDACAILAPPTLASAAMWLAVVATRNWTDGWFPPNWTLLPHAIAGAAVYVATLSVIAPSCLRDFLVVLERVLNRPRRSHEASA